MGILRETERGVNQRIRVWELTKIEKRRRWKNGKGNYIIYIPFVDVKNYLINS